MRLLVGDSRGGTSVSGQENSAMLAWGDSVQSSAAVAMLELIALTAGAVIYRQCYRNIVHAFLRRRLGRQTFRGLIHFRTCQS